ncbi:hypothetical protein J0M47_02495, partial [Pseudomonas aeruginosa]|uniref:hypothetical protein n=5 Tax=Pseudomonas aeruginosa TaxID=287 RepID=UPI0019D42AAC
IIFRSHQRTKKHKERNEEARRSPGFFIWTSGYEDRWGDGIAAHPPRVLAHVGTGEGAAIRFVAEGRGSPGEPKAGARGTASD